MNLAASDADAGDTATYALVAGAGEFATRFFSVFFGVLCVPPIILGLVLLIGHFRSDFGRFAGLLTLKPLVATPLWLLTLSPATSPSEPNILLSVLPGIGLTLLINILLRLIRR